LGRRNFGVQHLVRPDYPTHVGFVARRFHHTIDQVGRGHATLRWTFLYFPATMLRVLARQDLWFGLVKGH
ncbi:MAG: hypothetical protein MK239_08595, partial [Gemmatimonadetes bacterium]|nr:hypothetical protein [Gemmatimonadota bacterium]